MPLEFRIHQGRDSVLSAAVSPDFGTGSGGSRSLGNTCCVNLHGPESPGWEGVCRGYPGCWKNCVSPLFSHLCCAHSTVDTRTPCGGAGSPAAQPHTVYLAKGSEARG